MAIGAAGDGKTWQVGTLTYDRRGLVNVFTWMLWGDFCLNLMDSGVAPNLALIQLTKYGASATTIGLVTGTAVELMSMIMVAVVSTWSDRTRSRLGRRIPFMLYATPPLALFLAALGFSPQIAAWLQRVSPGLLGGLSASAATIAVFSALLLLYKFCDIFPQSVYYYLWADVIPPQLMGTFACLFRVVATAGVLLFNFFLLKKCETHPATVCLIAAALYCVAFLLLCLFVREGAYPPPEPPPPGPFLDRATGSIACYVRECYSLPFYWKFYLFNLCFMCGFVPFRNFLLLYGKDTLHIPLSTYGYIMTARDAVQMLAFLAMGPIIDRYHPLRAGLAGYALMVLTGLASSFLITGTTSFAAWTIATFVAVAVYQGATGALGPRLLPQSQYGQFCSANAFVWHLGLMVLTPVLGRLMDRHGNAVVFAWFSGFSAAGIVLLFLVYRDWKKLGGDESYVPPVTTPDPAIRTFEVVAKH
jgi:maltose/moltooligosaccharide transporter